MQVPPGFRTEFSEETRREAWLHSYCHDEEGRMIFGSDKESAFICKVMKRRILM